jgi:hypothetical protein
VALHKAAAAALEASLKDEAEKDWIDHETAITWRWGEDRLSTNHNSQGWKVSDSEALLDFLEQRTSAVQKTVVRSLPDGFLDSWMQDLAMDSEGRPRATFSMEGNPVVPGVVWEEGGGLKSISLVISDGGKRAARQAVQAYVEGDAPFPG